MTAVRREVSVRSQALGAELQVRRKAAGLEGLDIAQGLNWSTTKVSLIENGKRGITETEAAMYLAYCRTGGQDFATVMQVFEEHNEYWVQPHPIQQHPLRSLTALEATALAIDSFEPAIIPGLLQTSDYSRALFENAGLMPQSHVEPLVQARQGRQAIMNKRAPASCTFMIHENALRMTVGGPQVMNDQLLHLVFCAARPRVRVRVVPADVGQHPGIGGPFVLMGYNWHTPTVHVEVEAATLFINEPEIIARYRYIWQRLEQVALDPWESRMWLVQLAGEYDSAKDDGETAGTTPWDELQRS